VRIVFAGTPAFAAVALEAIIAAAHTVVCVLTQPDRPAGRGRAVRASPVRAAAERHRIALLQPHTLAGSEVARKIAGFRPDIMVVAAYGLLVPKSILEVPPRGCINIHASLLPRWRGAAPIQYALLAGDATTGVTIMQMDEGLDTGAILLQEPVAVTGADTAGTLHDRLASLGARLVVKALASRYEPRPQDPALATYAPKVARAQAEIRWADSAAAIERQVRAFNPAPGAYTYFNGTELKFWRAQAVGGEGRGVPGVVWEADATGIVVSCGTGSLRILELQRAGGRAMSTRKYLAGSDLAPGARLGR
jgi:methionyl-tRNA formyltransferase